MPLLFPLPTTLPVSKDTAKHSFLGVYIPLEKKISVALDINEAIEHIPDKDLQNYELFLLTQEKCAWCSEEEERHYHLCLLHNANQNDKASNICKQHIEKASDITIPNTSPSVPLNNAAPYLPTQPFNGPLTLSHSIEEILSSNANFHQHKVINEDDLPITTLPEPLFPPDRNVVLLKNYTEDEGCIDYLIESASTYPEYRFHNEQLSGTYLHNAPVFSFNAFIKAHNLDIKTVQAQLKRASESPLPLALHDLNARRKFLNKAIGAHQQNLSSLTTQHTPKSPPFNNWSEAIAELTYQHLSSICEQAINQWNQLISAIEKLNWFSVSISQTTYSIEKEDPEQVKLLEYLLESFRFDITELSPIGILLEETEKINKRLYLLEDEYEDECEYQYSIDSLSKSYKKNNDEKKWLSQEKTKLNESITEKASPTYLKELHSKNMLLAKLKAEWKEQLISVKNTWKSIAVLQRQKQVLNRILLLYTNTFEWIDPKHNTENQFSLVSLGKRIIDIIFPQSGFPSPTYLTFKGTEKDYWELEKYINDIGIQISIHK